MNLAFDVLLSSLPERSQRLIGKSFSLDKRVDRFRRYIFLRCGLGYVDPLAQRKGMFCEEAKHPLVDAMCIGPS